jgi:hypothetical protein
MALTTVQAYQRELEKLIAIEIERLVEPMANGFIETHEEYKMVSGKIAGLRTSMELMQEADRILSEKYR